MDGYFKVFIHNKSNQTVFKLLRCANKNEKRNIVVSPDEVTDTPLESTTTDYYDDYYYWICYYYGCPDNEYEDGNENEEGTVLAAMDGHFKLNNI